MNLNDIRKKINNGINLTNLNLRVTYYSRVSTEYKEQIKSLINQNEYFENYIKKNNNWTYVDGYIDKGISGTTDKNRKSFMKMIKDAKEDKFDLIITKEISRFSRNTLDSIKYTRELLNYGVAVLFINDNINTLYPDSELRLTIMASLAQDEIRRLSERIKFGMNQAQKKGVLLGNNNIYGYKKSNKENRLLIKKEEAEIVKKIFHLYAINDLSLTKIKDFLNDNEILTKEKKKWSTTTISRIIRNPKYKGFYCGNKTERTDYINKKIRINKQNEWLIYKSKKIPIIINEYLWNKANEKINKKYQKRSKLGKSIYSNKIYCISDNNLYMEKYFRKNKSELSFVCKNYLVNKKSSCDSANLRESELNKIISDLIIDNSIIEKINSIFKKEKIQKEVTNILNQIKIKMMFIDKIYTKKDDGIICLKIYVKDKIYLEKKDYIFYRGYDTSNTKRYSIKYKVEILQSTS